LKLPELIREIKALDHASISAVLAACAARLAVANEDRNADDELLDVAAAASRLKVSKSHAYHHAKQWPFTVRVGGKLLFSSRGIDRYLRSRQGAR
jgi:hypothetical protein